VIRNIAPPLDDARLARAERARAAAPTGVDSVASISNLPPTTATQRLAQQELATMTLRLDRLVAAMNTTTGAQRDQAMSVVIQELVSQVAAMRRMLAGSAPSMIDSTPSALAALPNEPAIFITPSGAVAQAQVRRSGVSGDPTVRDTESVIAGVSPTIPGASGVEALAASRRRGEP
jgi:hypothetical protein